MAPKASSGTMLRGLPSPVGSAGYGIGMALALIGAGPVLTTSRDRIAGWAEHRRGEGESAGALLRGPYHLHAAAAAAVVLVGFGLDARSVIGL